MAEAQPPTIVEGATTGDVEDEIPVAKSAEDRKAAAALSSLDAPREDDSAAKDVDQDAVRKAMDRLAGKGSSNGTLTKKEEEKQVAVKKNVKVDAADVALLVCGFLLSVWVLDGGVEAIQVEPVGRASIRLYRWCTAISPMFVICHGIQDTSLLSVFGIAMLLPSTDNGFPRSCLCSDLKQLISHSANNISYRSKSSN